MGSRPHERPPRILFVINSLARGGAETQLLRIAQAVQEGGADVVVATLRGENDFTRQVSDDQIAVWAPRSARGWDLPHMARLALRIYRWRPEVTVSFLFQATLFARLVNVVVRPRLAVASMRNEKLESRLREVIYRLSSHLDDRIVVNSRSARSALVRSKTIPADPRTSVVIYNGIDVGAIRARAQESVETTRRGIGVQPEQMLLLGVGRLTPQKGWPDLIAALRLVNDPRVRAVVAGDGPLRKVLTEQVGAPSAAAGVDFLGRRDDVPSLIRAADCLLLCSYHEGTPNVVLEALALGTPVIATDVGACRELLTGYDADLVPPGDPQSLAAAINRRAARRLETQRSPRVPSHTHDADMHGVAAEFSWPTVAGHWRDLLIPQAEGSTVETDPGACPAHTDRKL